MDEFPKVKQSDKGGENKENFESQQSDTVRAGDTLSEIALRFSVTQQDLIAANPKKIRGANKVIHVGDVLVIPGGE